MHRLLVAKAHHQVHHGGEVIALPASQGGPEQFGARGMSVLWGG